MSSNQQRTTLQCPSCGSTMNVQYSGDLHDKQVVCQACGTTFDVPDNFERVRKVKRTQKGFFRKREVVEEEIVERRSDFAPPQPQFQQSQGQPIVINIPGGQLRPSTASASGSGCVVAGIIISVVIIGVIAGIVAISQVNSSVSDFTGNTNHPVRENADRTINAHEYVVEYITFSPDGSKFVSTASNEWVLWDAETFGQIIRTEYEAFSAEFPTFINNGDQFIIDHSGDLHFYSSADGQEVRMISTRSGIGAISPDGTQYAFVSPVSEGDLNLMDLASERVQTLDSLTYYVDALVYTPDGQFVVVGGRESNFAIYSVATGERLYLGRSGFDRVDEIAFKPDTRLYITYNDGLVEFNEINENGVPTTVKTWTVDMDSITFSEGAVFSPDGETIAAGNFWGGAILWDASADEPTIVEQLAGDEDMSVIAFSPDGNSLITGDFRGTLYVYNLE